MKTKPSNNRINFLSFFDSFNFKPFAASFYSILENYEPKEFRYYIGISSKVYENYKPFFDTYKGIFIIRIIEDSKNETDIKIHKSITNFTLERLNVFNHFPELLSKKFVYLDCDLIFSGRISESFFKDEINYAFPDLVKNVEEKQIENIIQYWKEKMSRKYFKKIKKLIKGGNYFNAGVLIINDPLNFKKLLDSVKLFDVDDQTILNYFNKGNIKIFHDTAFNHQAMAHKTEKPIIYHFSGEVKPWFQNLSCANKPLRNSIEASNFNEYFDKTREISAVHKKTITLIVTIYKPTKEQINYWANIYKRAKKKKGIEVQFLVDGTFVDLPNFISGKDIFYSHKNLGKLLLIYDHIKSGNVVTDYFKACDPDDLISIDLLSESFNITEDNLIISYWFTYVDKRPNDCSESNIRSIIETVKNGQFDSFGNAWTIYPTNTIKNDTIFSRERFNQIDDQLLGYISYYNGGMIHHMKSLAFYLWVSGEGITSFENYFNFVEESERTFIEIGKYISASGGVNPITWPGKYGHFKFLKMQFIQKYENNPEKMMQVKEADKIMRRIINDNHSRLENIKSIRKWFFK